MASFDSFFDIINLDIILLIHAKLESLRYDIEAVCVGIFSDEF